MAGFLYHQHCPESGSEWEFGWRGESIIRQDGLFSDVWKKKEMQAVCAHFLFFWSIQLRVPIRKQKWCLQLHGFKSRHFQPLNPPIIVITTRRRPWHECNLKLSECYLLCPTETETSLRLKTKVNINPFSFLPSLLPPHCSLSHFTFAPSTRTGGLHVAVFIQ